MKTVCKNAGTRFRIKPRKPRKKTIYRWLRERTSTIDYGVKFEGHPIHCNSNETVLNAFSGCQRWLSRMTNAKFDAHFSGDQTFYFTGNSSPKFPETLLNIDIDCHKSGTLSGAIAFAEHLKEHYYPDLYYEVSTNGNGIHAYVVILKGDLGSPFLNGLFRRFEQHLRTILSNTKLDVENVEIKGTSPILIWGDRKGELQNYTSGTLAKLPRESHRFEELKKTTRLSYLDLLRLPPVDRNILKNAAISNPTVLAGSISGKMISEEDIKQLNDHYLKISEILMETHALKTTGRTVVTPEDMAIFLMLLRFFSTHMNRDGSLPYARFKKMWDAVFDSGDINRTFECKRFAAIRNYLSSLGLIEWGDTSFTLGTTDSDGKRVKGKAAKWKASDLLMSLLDWENKEIQQEKAGLGTDLKEKREEETSFAVTRIGEAIRNLTRQPLKDIQKPVLSQHISDSWLFSPEEASRHVQVYDDFLCLAV